MINKYFLILAFAITSPLGFGAFIVDMVTILTTKENKKDKSYFLIYIDEVNKYVKEL